ncbi:LuxR C-terminal-related transcriptional regulator [Actinokineospora guangxiensis]|uniref:LuxR C-terminal-related transcriptional regulator n=1 Tax=Actinokineospora guangxiensis TaxID=1490288 RepID=A0ABW0EXB9_9PSEU
MIPGHPHPGELVLDAPTRRLCDDIAAGGRGPVRLAVIAPGGYGKSALLDLLADGPGARRHRRGLAAEAGLVLVDDAHLLTDAALAEVAELAADDRVGLVVAARPWPRPAGLTSVLARLRGQIVLRPFDRDRVAACLRLSGEPADADAVLGLTGGVPGLVQRLAPHRGEVGAALEDFRFDIDRLDRDARRVLVAAEAGVAELPPGLLARPVAEVVAEVRSGGLTAPDGALLPVAGAAVRALVPAEERAEALAALAAARLAAGGPVAATAVALLEAGASGQAVAELFAAAARESEPDVAVRLYAAAAAEGYEVDQVGWAEAEVRACDPAAALRRVDGLIAHGTGGERGRAAAVAGAALAHRGQLARSAELYSWGGGAVSAAFAAIGHVGAGRLAEARAALADAGDAPPTVYAGAVTATARGLIDSLDTRAEATAAAVSTVVHAAEAVEPLGSAALLPDSPAAIAAIMAMHGGDPTAADPVLGRAVAAGVGGAPLAARHRLLRGWAAMVAGDEAAASAAIDPRHGPAEGRDAVFAAGLAVGVARRGSDIGALRRCWDEACAALARQPVDLFTLLPLGELAVAAARLGDRDRVAAQTAAARELLAALGDPPLWTTVPHWNALHADLLADDPDAAVAHAEALRAAADAGPVTAALADAARVWLQVVGGSVDRAAVEAAARALHAAGLRWDGARLAGQAAIRTPDRAAMVGLLECARGLQGPAATPAPDAAGEPARLSEREQQVAGLVLAGMTYRQIGDKLFISAKTVEHHMARMRSRLGAGSRAELLSRLRDLVRA